MSADKRSVATDALATLGTLIDEHQKRDAIHLAVEPVVAGEFLGPAEHITVENGVARRVNPGKGLGIVDPFLLAGIEKGQRFWFIMYPRMVTSLRHVWAHPAFPDELMNAAAPAASPNVSHEALVAAAWKWLDNYAEQFERTGKALVGAANDWLDHRAYLVGGSEMEGTSTSEEFWPYFTIVTGREGPGEDYGRSFFSCSC